MSFKKFIFCELWQIQQFVEGVIHINKTTIKFCTSFKKATKDLNQNWESQEIKCSDTTRQTSFSGLSHWCTLLQLPSDTDKVLTHTSNVRLVDRHGIFTFQTSLICYIGLIIVQTVTTTAIPRKFEGVPSTIDRDTPLIVLKDRWTCATNSENQKFFPVQDV